MEKSKRSFLPWGMVSTILTLAWPTMLEELMQTAVQYIDTAMVGAIGTQRLRRWALPARLTG